MVKQEPTDAPLTVVVGSTNPTKTRSAEQAIAKCFAGRKVVVSGFSVASGVSDQPMTEEETLTGARNRAAAACKAFAAEHNGQLPDFAVGMEGGVGEVGGGALASFAYMAVFEPADGGADGEAGAGKWGTARTGSYTLPPKVTELIRGGMELGERASAALPV